MGAACWGANGRRSVAAWHSTRPRPRPRQIFPVCSLVCLAWCAVSVCPVRWVETPRLPRPPHSRRTAYQTLRLCRRTRRPGSGKRTPQRRASLSLGRPAVEAAAAGIHKRAASGSEPIRRGPAHVRQACWMRGEQYPNACGAGGGSRGRGGPGAVAGRARRAARSSPQQPTAAHVARPSSVGFGLQAAGGGGRTCGRDGRGRSATSR